MSDKIVLGVSRVFLLVIGLFKSTSKCHGVEALCANWQALEKIDRLARKNIEHFTNLCVILAQGPC